MLSKQSIIAMLAATVLIVVIYIAAGGAEVQISANETDVQTDEGINRVCIYEVNGKGMNEDDLDMLQRGGFQKKGDAWFKTTSESCSFEMLGKHLKRAGFEVVQKGKTLVANKPAKAIEFVMPKLDAGLFFLFLCAPLAAAFLFLRRSTA